MTDMVKNYINFPPLGMIMVLTIGIGLVEKVGLLEVIIKSVVHSIPKSLVAVAIVLLSFFSHLASDSGIGTYLSLMIPYAFSYMVLWYFLFSAWYLLGWPTDPGVPQRL